MIIEIIGDPIAKRRHRCRIQGDKIICYDEQHFAKMATRGEINRQIMISLAHEDRQIAMEASNLASSEFFEVGLHFYMSPPKNISRSKLCKFLWLGDHSSKPDLDNMAKYYLDCGNGLLWKDDCQIISLKIKKNYSEIPRTIIYILARNQMAIHNSAEGILKLFTPDEFSEFSQDIEKGFDNFLKDLTKVEEGCENFWGYSYAAEDIDKISYRKATATAAAMFLSMIADKYSDRLSQIKKKYPNFWSEWPAIKARCEEILNS